MNTKSSLRQHFLELLKKQGSQQRLEKSRKIAAQLFDLPAFQEAKTVLFYASMPGEVETFAMMEQAVQLHKNVALPILERDQRKMTPTLTNSPKDLCEGPYGVRQPRLEGSKAVDLAELDAVIVPGLAFDKAKNRLGRGAGYYDRFLADLGTATATIGVAFDFQLTDILPVEEHDVPLDYVIAG